MRTLKDVSIDYLVMLEMSCKPTMKKPRFDDVIDEDKSVKWNRAEVERLMVVYDEEVKELNRKKNACRDELINEICDIIKYEVKNITKEDARTIWEYVSSNNDTCHKMFLELERLIFLIGNIVNHKNVKKKNRK